MSVPVNRIVIWYTDASNTSRRFEYELDVEGRYSDVIVSAVEYAIAHAGVMQGSVVVGGMSLYVESSGVQTVDDVVDIVTRIHRIVSRYLASDGKFLVIVYMQGGKVLDITLEKGGDGVVVVQVWALVGEACRGDKCFVGNVRVVNTDGVYVYGIAEVFIVNRDLSDIYLYVDVGIGIDEIPRIIRRAVNAVELVAYEVASHHRDTIVFSSFAIDSDNVETCRYDASSSADILSSASNIITKVASIFDAVMSIASLSRTSTTQVVMLEENGVWDLVFSGLEKIVGLIPTGVHRNVFDAVWRFYVPTTVRSYIMPISNSAVSTYLFKILSTSVKVGGNMCEIGVSGALSIFYAERYINKTFMILTWVDATVGPDGSLTLRINGDEVGDASAIRILQSIMGVLEIEKDVVFSLSYNPVN